MDNKRMVILVEGESELIFVQQIMIPQLYSACKEGWSIESCKIISNRKLNKKGGNVNYDYLCNDVARFVVCQKFKKVNHNSPRYRRQRW